VLSNDSTGGCAIALLHVCRRVPALTVGLHYTIRFNESLRLFVRSGDTGKHVILPAYDNFLQVTTFLANIPRFIDVNILCCRVVYLYFSFSQTIYRHWQHSVSLDN